MAGRDEQGLLWVLPLSGSFIAGTLSILRLMLLAPPWPVRLDSDPEYFTLMCWASTISFTWPRVMQGPHHGRIRIVPGLLAWIP